MTASRFALNTNSLFITFHKKGTPEYERDVRRFKAHQKLEAFWFGKKMGIPKGITWDIIRNTE